MQSVAKNISPSLQDFFLNMAVLQPNVFLNEYISDFTQTSNGLTLLML
jgi:hypothetical protein